MMLFGMLKDLLKDTIFPRSIWAHKKLGSGDQPADSVPRMSKEEADCRHNLELMPNSAEAHNGLGVVLKGTKRLAEAEAAFRRAIGLKGNYEVALYNLGVVLAETNRLWEAERAYRDALKLLPNFVEAHNNLGILLKDTKRAAEAEVSFRRALELNPDFVEAQTNLDIVHAEIQRLAKVEADCRRTLELTPNSADAYNNLGIVLKDARRFAEAEDAFRHAVDLEGDHVAALSNLGSVLDQTDRPLEAVGAYLSALKLRPTFVEGLYNLGGVLAETNINGEAEAAYRNALELQTDFVEAHINLGCVLRSMQRPAEAAAAFRRAIELKPDHEAAHRNLDFVLKEVKRLSEAEAIHHRAVNLQANCARSHYKLGLTRMALGKLDEAIASFQQAILIDPNYASAHNNLGVTFLRQGQVEQAIACYRRAISIKPHFARAMANLGGAYFRKNDFRQAANWNQAALAIDPQEPDANQNMAFMLLGTGHADEAKQHLDRAYVKRSLSIEYAADPIRTVLLLLTAKKGNVPGHAIEFLFPTDINTRVHWVIETADDDQIDDLPTYDLVFNAMGDPELIGDSIKPLSQFAEVCGKPLLNHPGKVAHTARNHLPDLLSGIDNIIVPAVWRFATRADWDESIVDQLPLLVRPVDSHGGFGLKLARTSSDLAQCRDSQVGPVYVCRFVDFRSSDSWFRKYRIIFVDRKPYPYHLAIAQNWMVHYYTAEMESCPWKLEEEEKFLECPEVILGSVGTQAMQAVGTRIDLDYFGIDFSVMENQQILVFEANPTMLVHPEDFSGPLKHKNEYVLRIQYRFEEMLKRLCH